MKTIALLADLHRKGILTGKQLGALRDIHLKKRFSLHYELRACIYIGVLFILAGLGLTVKQYFTQLGDIAIIGFLSASTLGAFIYCFLKGNTYSQESVASPNMAFDYVLFFGCTVYSLNIAYIETQFHVLADIWFNYLLVSSALFFYLAYRFDNRLVLSLSLSTLAAWFGFKLSVNMLHFHEYHRLYAIAYALLVFALGGALYRLSVKRHFLDIYLNFALHFIFISLVSGVFRYKFLSLYFPAMVVLTVMVILYARRTNSFLYLLCAGLYGYAGLSVVVVDIFRDVVLLFLYFILSSVIVVRLIFVWSRKLREGQ